MFAVFGLVLEALHGLKVAAYVDVTNETRRLMWRLAHAHGTLLSIVHVLFGLCVGVLPEFMPARERTIARCLKGATILLPGGFFLGGVVVYGGDPGLGIVLVPPGAVLLLVAVYLIAQNYALRKS